MDIEDITREIAGVLGEFKARIQSLDRLFDKEEKEREESIKSLTVKVDANSKLSAKNEIMHSSCREEILEKLKDLKVSTEKNETRLDIIEKEKEIETLPLTGKEKAKKALPYASGPGIIIIWETVIKPIIEYLKAGGGG